MTAIIAIKKNNKIYIGSDGVRTCEPNIEHLDNYPNNWKIQHILGSKHCFIATSGDANCGQVIKNIPNLLDGKEDISYNYLINRVIPKIFKTCKNSMETCRDNDYGYEIASEIIITTLNKLFVIDEYGRVLESNEMVCLGIGTTQLVIKYQEIKNSDLEAREMVLKCLDHAIKYGANIGYPLMIMNNANDDVEYIKSKDEIEYGHDKQKEKVL